MLIQDDEVNKRLNNPLNLLNRMKNGLTARPRNNAMDLFVRKGNGEISSSVASSVPALVPASVPAESNSIEISPSSSDVVDDIDTKIQLATAHDSALVLLNNSLNKLNAKIDRDEIKTSSIPAVIASASKVITDIRKERLEREKANKNENVHFHFYCPTQRKIEEFEVIEVN